MEGAWHHGPTELQDDGDSVTGSVHVQNQWEEGVVGVAHHHSEGDAEGSTYSFEGEVLLIKN